MMGLASGTIVNPQLLDEAITNVKATIKNCPDKIISLIIDTTLELPKDDPAIFTVLALLPQLKSGELNIVLCKSLQKYASLGLSKVQCGNITVINNQAPKFELYNQQMEKMGGGRPLPQIVMPYNLPCNT